MTRRQLEAAREAPATRAKAQAEAADKTQAEAADKTQEEAADKTPEEAADTAALEREAAAERAEPAPVTAVRAAVATEATAEQATAPARSARTSRYAASMAEPTTRPAAGNACQWRSHATTRARVIAWSKEAPVARPPSRTAAPRAAKA